MGAIAGMVGLGGGINGTGAGDLQQANIQSGVDTGQIKQAYNQTQNSMQSQNALLSAMQGQNGLANQNQVYNQLQGVASGQVNPAQAQFAQNTAANVANQAALMAGQRGASQNAGLMARQAAMQGAGIQQQAAGQAATQQAQNQISAIGAAGQMANTQAGQQIGQTNANVQSQQAEQGNLLNALGQQNSASVGSQGSVNAGNTAVATTGMGGQQQMIGGLMNSGATKLFGMADGGMAEPQPMQSQGPQSSFGRFVAGVSAPSNDYAQAPIQAANTSGNKAMGDAGQSMGKLAMKQLSGGPSPVAYAGPDSAGAFAGMASKGGMVDVVVSPGEKIVPPKEVQKVAQGGTAKMQTVPGKAEVPGDSVKNDKVAAKLPAGSVVVKRTRANNNPDGFIREVLAKRKGSK